MQDGKLSYIYKKPSDEAIDKIWEMQNKHIFKFNNKKCIHILMNKSFICITTEDNLNFISSCTEYFSDGTFQFAPNFFKQMYTVHCFKNGFYLIVVKHIQLIGCRFHLSQSWWRYVSI